MSMFLATCAAVLCAFVAPAAAGSGIPEVKAYLNGVDAHSILAPSTLLVKVGKKMFLDALSSLMLILSILTRLHKNWKKQDR